MTNSNRDEIDLTAPVVREFRVKCVRRYVVTDWSDYRGGEVRELCEATNLSAANEIAATFGRAYPGSLVNGMDASNDGMPQVTGAPASRDASLRLMPYDLAASVRRDARYRNDVGLLADLDRLRVAVDA